MTAGRRLPTAAHAKPGWVISRIAPDFTLLDAWALPIEGRYEDRDAAFEFLAGLDPTASGSVLSKALFAIRLWIGARLGWDDADRKRSIPGDTMTTLRDRLPEELRAGAEPGPGIAGGFVPLYRTNDEWAAEISNDTVHGVVHVAWVEHEPDRYRAQMGVYVKPRGTLGALYLRFIGPFRHLIVYPALLRSIERAWREREQGNASTRRDGPVV